MNTYQYPVCLIIPESSDLVSTEGTMQSDPLVTVMYALAVTPLIHPSFMFQWSHRFTGLVC